MIVTLLFYNIELRNLFENHRYKIETFTSQISNRLITSHMIGDTSFISCVEGKRQLCFQDIKESDQYQVAFYDKTDRPFDKDFNINLRRNDHFFEQDNALYFIDDSAQLHLNVQYVVAKYDNISTEINALRFKIFIGFAFALLFSTVLGLFLARMFLSPIREEIQRLNRFIKDSTHELNTPLSAILMSVSSLKDIEEKKRKRIELSAKRIATLYQNLCYLLLRDTEQQEPKSDIDLKLLIEERVHYVADFMEAKKIKITLNLEDKQLFAGKESMTKLIDNLLSNATKYTNPEGSITIELTQKYLRVQDTGIGIKEDMQQEIFKRYKRANNTHGGFGIGLDIVSTVCKENNFTITLDSQENEGTIFTIYF